jgi:PTH1 family peptidyl-tRNA hydrolase
VFVGSTRKARYAATGSTDCKDGAVTVDSAPWLIVGLGNPGAKYEATRHNIGFLVADELAARMGARSAMHKKARAEVAEGRLQNQRIVVAKPMQFMNESGGPTKGLLSFYKIPNEHLVVIHDELDLNFAQLRLKLGGGDNGHNGLKSLTSSFGTAEYFRVRLGIGRPMGQQDPADFVLKQFSKEEKKTLDEFIDRGADCVEFLIEKGLDLTQLKFNS